ncbi:MAG TPA: hypothetical protein VNT23_06800 [Gaiellaceae bacterium]|nr:hypothetical protein [Gaiellaceae bacterium]
MRGLELFESSGQRLQARFGADDGLAGGLALCGGRPSPLLRLPVPLLRRGDGLPAGLLGLAEGGECRLGGGGLASCLTEFRPGGALAAPVRHDDQGAGARPERVVLLLMLRLEREPADLRLELRDEVGDARQVVERPGEADRRLVALDLEALDAGRLLEQLPPLLGPERQRRVDRPLPDHDQLVRPEPSLPEQLDHVPKPRTGAVDQVLALAGPIRAAPDAHLGEVDRQPAVVVVERQGRLGHALRLALLRPGEDDVVGASRAE